MSDEDSQFEYTIADMLNRFDPDLEEKLLNGDCDHIPIDIENCSLTDVITSILLLSYDESLALMPYGRILHLTNLRQYKKHPFFR